MSEHKPPRTKIAFEGLLKSSEKRVDALLDEALRLRFDIDAKDAEIEKLTLAWQGEVQAGVYIRAERDAARAERDEARTAIADAQQNLRAWKPLVGWSQETCAKVLEQRDKARAEIAKLRPTKETT